MEVAFCPQEGTARGPGMQVSTLPGGRMARTFHRGPCEECGPTCLKRYAWLEGQGFSIAGPMRKIPPEEILTGILTTVG